MPIKEVPVGYQSLLGTSYEVTFPDFPNFSLLPAGVELHQKAHHHDVLVLKYNQMSNWFLKALKTGVTVQVTWKNSNNIKGTFTGYFSYFKRTKAGQNIQGVNLVCVGGSFPLKQTGTNVWTNKSLSEIVKDIANKTGFKAIVTPHPTKYSYIAQHGLSYWELLVELAHRAGHAVYVRGVNIYFQSFDDVVNKNMGTIPTLVFDQPDAPPFHASLERTLDKFEPILSDYAEYGDLAKRRNKKITAIDPITAKVYNVQSSPQTKQGVRATQNEVLFDEQGSTQVATNLEFANSLAKAKSEHARFTMPAKFSAQGDARIAPYSMIEISGIDSQSDGYWMVHEVVHAWGKTGKYTCEGVCLTDGKGQNQGGNQRYKQSGKVPALNLTNFNDGGSITLPKSPKLTAPAMMYSQSSSGYTLNARKWV